MTAFRLKPLTNKGNGLAGITVGFVVILAAMILYSMTYTALDTIGRSHIPVIVLGILMMFIFIFDNKMWKRKNYADEIYSNDFKKSSR